MSTSSAALCCSLLLVLATFSSCRQDKPVGMAEESVITSAVADREDPAVALLSTLNTRQKIGQLMIVDLKAEDNEPVLELDETIRAALADLSPGGVVFYGANLKTPEQVRALAGSITGAINVPPFIAVDHEGGVVDRLDDSGEIQATDLPSAATIGLTGDPDLAYRIGGVMGRELSVLGINMNFAPVADILSAPGSAIGSRSYGSDPALVSQMVRMTVKGVQEQGVSAVLKHFPGHGAALGDTHSGAVYLDKKVEELFARELMPFAAGVEEGVDGIMVAHIIIGAVGAGGLPATLSPELLTGVLRDRIGFDGLIITDSLTMKAVSEVENPAVEAIRAGADILLKPGNARLVRSQILAALSDGSLTLDRIDESVLRIIRTKLKRGIGGKQQGDPENVLGSDLHSSIVAEAIGTP